MSLFGDEIHKLLTRLKGGEELAQHEVEAVVNAAVTHFVPMLENLRGELTTTFTEALTQARQEIQAALEAAKAEIKAEVAGRAGAPQAGETSDGPATGTTSLTPDPEPSAPAE